MMYTLRTMAVWLLRVPLLKILEDATFHTLQTLTTLMPMRRNRQKSRQRATDSDKSHTDNGAQCSLVQTSCKPNSITIVMLHLEDTGGVNESICW